MKRVHGWSADHSFGFNHFCVQWQMWMCSSPWNIGSIMIWIFQPKGRFIINWFNVYQCLMRWFKMVLLGLEMIMNLLQHPKMHHSIILQWNRMCFMVKAGYQQYSYWLANCTRKVKINFWMYSRWKLLKHVLVCAMGDWLRMSWHFFVLSQINFS